MTDRSILINPQRARCIRSSPIPSAWPNGAPSVSGAGGWAAHGAPRSAHASAGRVTEAVDDRRGRMLRTLSPLITGSPDRHRRNADTMETTLAAIKAAAEGPGR
jgi:hypothetical protein